MGVLWIQVYYSDFLFPNKFKKYYYFVSLSLLLNMSELVLLQLFHNPNCQPAPNNWKDIVKFLLPQYYYHGVAGLVLKSNGEYKAGNLTNMIPAKNIQYNSSNNQYIVNIKYSNYYKNIFFTYDEQRSIFTAVDGSNEMALIVFGNWDYDNCQFISPFKPYEDIILTYNHIISSSMHFYQNSCRPSSIVTLTSNKDNDEGYISREDKAKMQKAVQDFKDNFKGTNNTGKCIINSDFEAKVTPISIPTNASDTVTQLNMLEEILYSFNAGMSKSVISGLNEYSNNALEKLKNLHDGTFTFFEESFIEVMNNFLLTYLEEFDAGNIKRLDTYFSLKTSHIGFYKQYKAVQYNEIWKLNGLDEVDYYNLLTSLGEEYAGIEKPNTNRKYNEIGRGNTLSE